MRFREIRLERGEDPENPYDQYQYLEGEFEQETTGKILRAGKANHTERGRAYRLATRRKSPRTTEERLAPGAFAVLVQLEKVKDLQHDKLLEELHTDLPEDVTTPSRLREIRQQQPVVE
jgi:hypothetical protein